MHYNLYVGTNSVRGSEGIYRIVLDGDTGEMSCRETIPFYNSGYLVRSENGERLYALSESMTFRGSASGGVTAYDVSGEKAIEINSQITHGQRPCQAALSGDGKTLYVGNFFGGTVAVFPIKGDGSIGEAENVIHHQRTSSFRAGIHCVMPHPQGKCLAAIELAHNAINLYDPNRNYEQVYELVVPEMTFPRHMVFSPDGKFLYLLSQEKSCVFVYSYDPDRAEQLTEIQKISTLPEDFSGINEAAAIRLHPGGKFIATSNRGVGEGRRLDSVTMFSRSEETGLLTQLQVCPTKGRTPRDVQFTKDGKWLVAALQASDTLESYRVTEDGLLELAASGCSIPSPACISQ